MARAVDLEKTAIWRERLLRFSRSGLSLARFCMDEGVSAPSFYVWRKRLAQDSRADEKFLPVRLTSTVAPAKVGSIEIRLPNGVRVRLPGDNLAALRAGIQAAAVASC